MAACRLNNGQPIETYSANDVKGQPRYSLVSAGLAIH